MSIRPNWAAIEAISIYAAGILHGANLYINEWQPFLIGIAFLGVAIYSKKKKEAHHG